MNSRQTFLRLLTFVAPFRNRLLLAVVLGAATVGSSVALMGTSAYLISAAALRPSVADLAVAVVAVRTFGISRGLFRYLERLVSHDLSFRLLADLRVWFFARLEPLAPAGLQEERSGDLLSRAISDVDTLQNVFVRALAPPLVALTIASATALTLWLLLPALALPIGGIFVLAGVGMPGLAFLLGRINGRRLAASRGDLAADLVETLQGTAEIVAYGRQDDVLARLARSDRELGRLSVGTAVLNGFTESLSGLCAGLAVWLALLIAIPAVRAGVLPGVELGVVALLTLAAFEAIAPLPSAFHQLELSLQAARRLFAIADTESPVQDPLRPLPVPTDTTIELIDARLRYGADEPWVLNELNLRLTRAGASPWLVRVAWERPASRTCWCGFATSTAGPRDWADTTFGGIAPTTCGESSGWRPRMPTFSTGVFATMFDWLARMPHLRQSRLLSAEPGFGNGFSRYRPVWILRSARRGSKCPAASGSASQSPALSSPTFPSSSSTSQPPIWTIKPPKN